MFSPRFSASLAVRRNFRRYFEFQNKFAAFNPDVYAVKSHALAPIVNFKVLFCFTDDTFCLQAINHCILIEGFREHWTEGVVDIEEDAASGVCQVFVDKFGHCKFHYITADWEWNGFFSRYIRSHPLLS